MSESFTPYPKDDRPDIVLHQRFIYLVIDICIFWLKDQFQSLDWCLFLLPRFLSMAYGSLVFPPPSLATPHIIIPIVRTVAKIIMESFILVLINWHVGCIGSMIILSTWHRMLCMLEYDASHVDFALELTWYDISHGRVDASELKFAFLFFCWFYGLTLSMCDHEILRKHVTPYSSSILCASDRSMVTKGLLEFSWPPLWVVLSTSSRDHIPLGARCYPTFCGWYPQLNFLQDGPQPVANNLLQPPTSSLCHFFVTWDNHMAPRSSAMIVCLKVGLPNLKVCLVIW